MDLHHRQKASTIGTEFSLRQASFAAPESFFLRIISSFAWSPPINSRASMWRA